MMIGKRKEERRVCTVLLQVIIKSLTPSENRLTAMLNWKKPKSNLEFKPGLPRQNAIALPLVPPPLPTRTSLQLKSLVGCETARVATSKKACVNNRLFCIFEGFAVKNIWIFYIELLFFYCFFIVFFFLFFSFLLPFLALTLCSPIDGMASNILINTTWRR